MTGETKCPLLAQSRHWADQAVMTAFGGKADIPFTGAVSAASRDPLEHTPVSLRAYR
jgi:hypothetical protein